MTNWMIIKDGIVVSIVKKDTNITNDDYVDGFDTVQDDPSEQFKVGDIFTLDKWFEYNPQLITNISSKDTTDSEFRI